MLLGGGGRGRNGGSAADGAHGNIGLGIGRLPLRALEPPHLHALHGARVEAVHRDRHAIGVTTGLVKGRHAAGGAEQVLRRVRAKGVGGKALRGARGKGEGRGGHYKVGVAPHAADAAVAVPRGELGGRAQGEADGAAVAATRVRYEGHVVINAVRDTP